MNTTVLSIRRDTVAPGPRKHSLPAAKHTIKLPLKGDDERVLTAHLNEYGLLADANGIWIGYANLQRAAMELLRYVGTQWPAHDEPNESAVARAIANAIGEVKAGLERKETDRRYVIVNFHKGLAVAAKDLGHFKAWGCTAQRVLAQWTPFEQPFSEWCAKGEFDRVLFAEVDPVNRIDPDGLLLRMRSAIAPINDLGVIHRYEPR
jgi:hypothetical protein